MKTLRERRIEKGLTQVQAALKVGASLTSYRLWESGVTTPNEENKKKLEKFLGKEEK